MSRPGDKGPYAPWNVKTITVEANVSEGQKAWPSRRPVAAVVIHCKKTSKTLTGRKLTVTHRKNISLANFRRWRRVKAGSAQAKTRTDPALPM